MFNEGDKVEITYADDKEMIGKRYYVNRFKNYTNKDSVIYQLCGVRGWFRERHLKKVVQQ